MKIRNKPRNAPVYCVDIGKNVFHVVGGGANHAACQVWQPDSRWRVRSGRKIGERLTPASRSRGEVVRLPV
jgi:hypothetical protein